MGTKALILAALAVAEKADADRHFESTVEGIVYAVPDAACEEVSGEDWTQEGKYQYGGAVYKVTVEDQEEPFWVSVNQSRSGSYHTDWWHTGFTAVEVVPEEVTETITRTVWKVI